MLDQTFYGNTFYQWIVASGVVVASFLVGRILMWTSKRALRTLTAKTASKFDDIILDMLEEPLVIAIVLAGLWWANSLLTLPENVEKVFNGGFHLALVLLAAWAIVRLIDALIVEYLAPIVKDSESDLDDLLLPILRRSSKIVIWVLGLIVGLNNAGYDVGAVVAGLGIGGLAFALAAQDTVSNLFGGVTIFTDRPFTINDRVMINGFDGYIKEIGLRSTRLQTLAGRTVTIPNRQFTDNAIENISSEPSRKVVLNLGLVYETSAEQIEKAMALLRGIANTNPNTEETVYVAFTNFGDFSLGILFIYYIKSGADILETQSQVNLQILSQFGANGLEMAFPTQTIHTITQAS